MNQKLAYYQDNLNSLTQQLDAAEQTKALDISQQQNQIQKLDQDLKQIAEKFQKLKTQDTLSDEASQQHELLVEFQR